MPAATALVNSTSPFVSKTLERILLFAHPTDAVVCLNTHWHIRSAAGQALRCNLGMPKNGVLLLKYPQCFASKEDLRYGGGLYHFLSLIKHNVNLKYPNENSRMIKELRKFLAGYEIMLLSVVCANLNLYTDLTTFIIDFSFFGDDFPRSAFAFFYTISLKELPEKTVKRLTSDFAEFRGARRTLFIGWKRWMETITEVVCHSASTLKHFIFMTPDEKLRNGNNAFKVELPRKFYATLRFDKLLAGMQSLQTLHFPALRKYEHAVIACRKRNKKLHARQHAWKALHDLPDNKRLPNLRRIVVNEWRDLTSSTCVNAEKFERVCGLPSFPKLADSDVMTVVTQARVPYNWGPRVPTAADLAQFPLVFPSVRVGGEKRLTILEIYLRDTNRAAAVVKYPVDYVAGDVRKYIVQENSLAVQVEGLPIYIERLSMPNMVVPAVKQNKLHGSLECAHFYGRHYTEPDRRPVDAESRQAWFAALCRLPLANMSLPTILTFKIKCLSEEPEDDFAERRKSNAEFVTQLVLPLFAVDGPYALPASVLHACRLKIESKNVSTVTDIVRNWGLEHQEAYTHEASLLLTQRYRFPAVSLHIEWPFWWGAKSSDDAEYAVPALLNVFYTKKSNEDYDIEQKQQLVVTALDTAYAFMTCKIDAFLRDAVESYWRRDVAFHLYQSLTQCRFVLSFTVMNRKPNVVEQQILALIDAMWATRAMQYERQLLAKVHDSTVDECLDEYALALPSLKSVQMLVQFSYIQANPANEEW